MAKKQTKKVEVDEPYVEETVVLESPKPEPEPKLNCKKEKLPPEDNSWEMKDRMYYLRNGIIENHLDLL
jgi:hypothetical protein